MAHRNSDLRAFRRTTDMSFNLPVLVGFNNGMYLDPAGGSIAEAIAVLRGGRDYRVRFGILER